MRRVNGRWLLAGGLLAGLAMNVGHAVAEAATRAEQQRMIERLALFPVGEATMLAIALGGFVVGIVAVWLYAAIRPRYGAGAATAIRAGGAVWILACLFPNGALLAYGILTPTYFWMATIADLVIVPAGTLAGAWAYRERGAADAVSPAGAARAHA